MTFWFDVLDEQQSTDFLSGIVEWDYHQHSGKLIKSLGNKIVQENSPDQMSMADGQINFLMDKSAPYTYAALLQQSDPAIFDSIVGANRYAHMHEQLERARNRGLNTVPDLQTYCMLSIVLGTRFDEHPIAASVLAGSNGDLAEQGIQWIDEQVAMVNR